MRRTVIKMPANVKRTHLSCSHTEAQVYNTLDACDDVLKKYLANNFFVWTRESAIIILFLWQTNWYSRESKD